MSLQQEYTLFVTLLSKCYIDTYVHLLSQQLSFHKQYHIFYFITANPGTHQVLLRSPRACPCPRLVPCPYHLKQVGTMSIPPETGWYHVHNTWNRFVPRLYQLKQAGTMSIPPETGWYHVHTTWKRLVPCPYHLKQVGTMSIAPETRARNSNSFSQIFVTTVKLSPGLH